MTQSECHAPSSLCAPFLPPLVPKATELSRLTCGTEIMRTNSEYHDGPVSPLRPEVHIETLPSEIEQVKKQ